MKKNFKGIKVYGGKADNIKEYLKENTFTDEVGEGDIIKLGTNTKITVYDVPCHTEGHVLYYLTDHEDKYPSFEGTAGAMLKNFKKIATFPKETKIYPGHEFSF